MIITLHGETDQEINIIRAHLKSYGTVNNRGSGDTSPIHAWVNDGSIRQVRETTEQIRVLYTQAFEEETAKAAKLAIKVGQDVVKQIEADAEAKEVAEHREWEEKREARRRVTESQLYPRGDVEN